jgi:hypothetical protein
MNVMRVDTSNYLMCDNIEEYLRFEQHCLSVAQQVQEEVWGVLLFRMGMEDLGYCDRKQSFQYCNYGTLRF